MDQLIILLKQAINLAIDELRQLKVSADILFIVQIELDFMDFTTWECMQVAKVVNFITLKYSQGDDLKFGFMGKPMHYYTYLVNRYLSQDFNCFNHDSDFLLFYLLNNLNLNFQFLFFFISPF